MFVFVVVFEVDGCVLDGMADVVLLMWKAFVLTKMVVLLLSRKCCRCGRRLCGSIDINFSRRGRLKVRRRYGRQ